jgi:hypothetical protein
MIQRVEQIGDLAKCLEHGLLIPGRARLKRIDRGALLRSQRAPVE